MRRLFLAIPAAAQRSGADSYRFTCFRRYGEADGRAGKAVRGNQPGVRATDWTFEEVTAQASYPADHRHGSVVRIPASPARALGELR